ncbi:hypothetical protein XENTR_v10014341 [Xenopus tropicalis]|uniref:Uncharacterized LOC101732574 n=1 Tax=Xenopus tropicalis TaxID=8364 RepID=A0A803J797_XENTR|nr:uncharacterized protein LOC101732574 [Xenopus tropicalis]XP_012818821.2 uncharacterized protein LOC101732574 [Xenopus tropicalis]KAE8603455.1 hypothetical protein XENTR_v10014341 [Xenopus tropicalis]
MDLSSQPLHGSPSDQLNHNLIAPNQRNPQREVSLYQQELVEPLIFKTNPSGLETINLYCHEMGYLYHLTTGSFFRMNTGSLPLLMPGTNQSTFQHSESPTARLPYDSSFHSCYLESSTHKKTATFSCMESKHIKTLNNKLAVPATDTESKFSQSLQVNMVKKEAIIAKGRCAKNSKTKPTACAIGKPIPQVQTESGLPLHGNLLPDTGSNSIAHIQERVSINTRSIKLTPARSAKSKTKKSATDGPSLAIQVESSLLLQCNSVTDKVVKGTKCKSKSSLGLALNTATPKIKPTIHSKSKTAERPSTPIKIKSSLPLPGFSVQNSQITFDTYTKRSKYSLGLSVNEATSMKSIPTREINSKNTEHVIDKPTPPVKTKSAQTLQQYLSKSTKSYFAPSNQRKFGSLTYAECVKINLHKPAMPKPANSLIEKTTVPLRKNVLSSQKKTTPTKKTKPRKKSKKKKHRQAQNIRSIQEAPNRQSNSHPLRRCKKSYPIIWSFIKPFNRRSRHHKIHQHRQIVKPTCSNRCRNHIMASNVHEIINSPFVKNASSCVPPALLNKLLNCDFKIWSTAQPWAVRMEEEAIKTYKNLKLENDNQKVQVSDYDFLTNSEKSWLAGVCRTVSNRGSKDSWPLLVKCLHKHPDSTLVQATKHRCFCLKKEGYIYTLRKDHAYYTQLQFLMDITDNVYAELLVHTNKETAIVPVWIDFDFLEEAEKKLERFYTDIVLPYLLKSGGCKMKSQHHKELS